MNNISCTKDISRHSLRTFANEICLNWMGRFQTFTNVHERFALRNVVQTSVSDQEHDLSNISAFQKVEHNTNHEDQHNWCIL